MPILPNAIPPEWVEAGKPTRRELFVNIIANQESFNEDIELLKQTSRISIFNTLISGSFSEYSEAEFLLFSPTFRAQATGFITEIRLAQVVPGTGGSVNIQIDKSIDGGSSWAPILATPVSMQLNGQGSSSGTVNFIVGGETFDQNDFLRVRIISASGASRGLHINVYGELA